MIEQVLSVVLVLLSGFYGALSPIYLKKGFPEKQFLKLLPSTLENLRKHLNQDEVNASIGKLKKLNAINFKKEIVITNEGKKLLNDSGLKIISADDLSDAANKAVAAVKGRN